ncbi:hypothetical protein TKK_0001654 [Trichogramma kaykai]
MFINSINERGPKVDDISVEIRGQTFDGAIKIIKNDPAKYLPYSILMFRNVEKFPEIEYDHYLKEIQEGCNAEYLEKVDDDGIFKNISGVLNKRQMQKIPKPANNEPPVIPENDEWKYTARVVEEFFTDHETQKFYIRDIEDPPLGFTDILGNINSNISLNNEGINIIPGINTPMHYIGMENSYTPMHEEDGGLSSINILKDGVKIWIVVPKSNRAEFENKVFEALKEKKLTKCSQVMKHKTYFITPRLLDEWGITYSIVIQRKGDMFYIRAGVYHAVINLTRNIAEAINYGCKESNANYEPFVCQCKDSCKINVPQNTRIVTKYEQLTKIKFNCYSCSETFITKTKLREHIKRLHDINFKFKCQYCDKKYNRINHLNRHIKTHTTEKSTCKLCSKKFSRLAEHIKISHTKRSTCQFCGKTFSAKWYEKHVSKCQNKTPLICILCNNNREFSSQRYLTQHQRQKHPNTDRVQ